MAKMSQHIEKYDQKTYASISLAIGEYAIPAMCKRWSNKNKTRQLKMSSRQSKIISTITKHTTPKTSQILTITKQFRCKQNA